MPDQSIIILKISDISYDGEYKYSSGELSQELVRSVSENGILQPLSVFSENDKFRIITGHNRYKAALENGVQEIPAFICDLNLFDFNSFVLMKNYHNQISPVNKLKYIYNFKVTDLQFLKKLNVPVAFTDLERCSRILDLPAEIIDYLDIKNVNYKVIEKITGLDACNLKILSDLIKPVQMKINIFRDIVSMLSDFSRFGIACDFSDIKFESLKKYEDDVVGRMKTLRFPRLSASLEKSGAILQKYKNSGIEIRLPEYFEGNSISFRFDVKNVNDFNRKMTSLQNVKMSDIEELLKLL
ncbi:MAG: ParB N-terminal domain-containing protein [Spirochaetes bacterium]|nr:ParB N-terminal domain-containing protein [Spirochaetota bacterium]